MRLPRKTTWLKGAAALACTMFVTANAFAQGPPPQPSIYNSLAITLLVIIIALALAIGLLAYVVLGAAQITIDRHREAKAKQSDVAAKVFTMTAFCLLSSALLAQDTASTAAPAAVVNSFGGLSATTFYLLVSIISLELLVLVVLVFQLKALMSKEKPEPAAEAVTSKSYNWAAWWEKINSFRPQHEEETMDMGHEYDGIRELDNRLPKWWLYGFYICILFACVYVYRFHISHTGLSGTEEYAVAVAKADIEKEEYLKKSANAVDENTVQMITDANALADAKKLFTSTCAACHGPEGGGIVGPNLTDEYWLHKGGVKDIFKTIKYGVPEKGMKSWKDDLSPVQIAQLASFIKSINGTKPTNPKEPQGEVYKDEAVAADSTTMAAK